MDSHKQTHSSLIPYLLEEAYEVVDAIQNGNDEELKEELGDLLLQIVLHAQIAKEENRFCLEDIANNLNQKLIRRHPHVFENKKSISITEVKESWEKIKAKERVQTNSKMGPTSSFFLDSQGRPNCPLLCARE